MYPILFNIGSLTIYTYNVILSIAFLLGLYLVLVRAKKEGISKEKVLVLSIYLIIFTQLGAKIFSLIFEQSNLFKSGSIYYGGIITGILIITLYCYKEKLDFWRLVNIYAPAIALGQAIGKIGCYLNGCCYGEIFFIPTQIFESITSLIIFLILLRISKNQFLRYLILYGTSRFIIEIFRQDYRGEIIFNLFTISQFISILSIISASVILKIKMSFRNDSSFVIANPVVSLRTGSSEAISKKAHNYKYNLVVLLLLATIFCSGNQCQCPEFKDNTQQPSQPTPGTPIEDLIINTAKDYIGTPYLFGGKTPKGFDCSGFTYYVLKEVGINIPLDFCGSAGQYNYCEQKGYLHLLSERVKGDLVFYTYGTRIHGHVAFYEGKTDVTWVSNQLEAGKEMYRLYRYDKDGNEVIKFNPQGYYYAYDVETIIHASSSSDFKYVCEVLYRYMEYYENKKVVDDKAGRPR